MSETWKLDPQNVRRVVDANGEYVATAHGSGLDAWKRAKRIRALPQLEAACDRTLKELKAWHKNTGVWAELQDELRAALAAARGEVERE